MRAKCRRCPASSSPSAVRPCAPRPGDFRSADIFMWKWRILILWCVVFFPKTGRLSLCNVLKIILPQKRKFYCEINYFICEITSRLLRDKFFYLVVEFCLLPREFCLLPREFFLLPWELFLVAWELFFVRMRIYFHPHENFRACGKAFRCAEVVIPGWEQVYFVHVRRILPEALLTT